MHLVLVHYHLNRGGVTQVILNHLRSLARHWTCGDIIDNITILFGGRREGWPNLADARLPVPVRLCPWPELDYDSLTNRSAGQLDGKLSPLLDSLGFSPDQTLLHVHNHALGKNVGWTAAISPLAQAGYRMLLQIHDFAEDYRPENYQVLMSGLAPNRPFELSHQLYPQAQHVHYAVLNSRDRAVLTAAGVAATNLHDLPNPVPRSSIPQDREAIRKQLAERFAIPSRHRLVLYPVRGIRRKNLGELLLWSALRDTTIYGVTLAPLNVAEQPSYQRWCSLAQSLDLPIVFGLGESGGLSLVDNLAAADALITTSVAEGFGMVFLESLLAGRPLTGRDLPEVTLDFRQRGIDFPWLSAQLRIPRSWLGDLTAFHAQWAAAVDLVRRDYHLPELSPGDKQRAFERLISGDAIDFAQLDSQRQAAVIRRVRAESARRRELLELNTWLPAALTVNRSLVADQLDSQAGRVEQEYSLERAGQRLGKIYRTLAESARSEVHALEHGQKILMRYLDPVRLHLIRLEK